MAQTTRQTNLLVEQDWTKVYQSFTNADFTSYDFETLRSSMINYIKIYYPETFNDFLESSEYLALIDLIAFLGQSLSFRTDLNARENYLDTAQRRESILKLARMLSYNPTRTISASGLLKFDSISTTENVTDSSGINLANTTIFWNDLTNDNWLEQFNTVLNASMISAQAVGKPGNSQIINGVQTDEYTINLNPTLLPRASFVVNLQTNATTFEAVSASTVGQSYIYERDPTTLGQFNILYQNDNNGNGSNNTGFFLYFKQGTLQTSTFTVQNAIPNNFVTINSFNINNNDSWLYALDVNNNAKTLWTQVPALPGQNVIYNQSSDKNLYQVNTLNNDQVNLIFGDGSFSNIPQGPFRFYFRTANGYTYSITPDDMAAVTVSLNYVSTKGVLETLTVVASLKYTVTNAAASQSLASVKTYAPQQYYTQNRMITGEDYNIFPLTNFTSIQKVKAVNRTSSGVSMYLDTLDPTGSFSSTNIFGVDGILTANNQVSSLTFDFLTKTDIYNAIYNNIIPAVNSTGMVNYYYANYQSFVPPHGNIIFVQSSNTTASSTGNLTYNNTVQQIGTGISGNLQYVAIGSSLQFSASGTTIHAAVTGVVDNTDVNTPSQLKFGTVVPSGAILQSIIPPYKNDFNANLITTIGDQIQARVNFGITYDQLNQVWVNILPASIGTSNNWLMKFNYNQGLYNVQYKTLNYIFGSTSSTTFYFDPKVKVYDSIIGAPVTDSIKVLKINSYSGNSTPIGSDVVWQIYNVVTAPDGYVDSTQVYVKSPATQMENVPDNPYLYKTVADTAVSRDSLYFQYKHNVPARSRIDPTPINIIDLYILTAEYTTSYVNWLRDLTGTVKEPVPPTSSSLEIAYSKLDNFKTISDTLIYNPAKFKPLFGSKADISLQARFQVVINPSVSITPNEIKSRVISAIDQYFNISNWDFGDTFYFSELAAYLHSTLVPNVASIIIVPVDTTLKFGNYFQVNAEPWEIITSAATVNDIDIITAINPQIL
jgi:hypothetical protein